MHSRSALSLVILAPVILALPSAVVFASPAETPGLQRAAANYGKLPLSFEANEGQSDAAVRFLARGRGYSVYLTDRAAVLALTRGQAAGGRPAQRDRVRMELQGASRHERPAGAGELPGKVNYFTGAGPDAWHVNLPAYARVKYTAVYPGVDLLYYGNQGQLEYDFVVAPHASAQPVRLHFEGARALRLSAQGDLAILAKGGEVDFRKPVVYQVQQGRRVPVEGAYRLLQKNTVGFRLGTYDHERPLVIDPTLQYSTYLGGAGSDSAQGIAVDQAGNAYVTGYTDSTSFPTKAGSYQPASSYTQKNQVPAVFVSKLNAAGTALVYSTYLSGTVNTCTAGQNYNALTQGDFATSIAIDSANNAYVAGGTCASNFPVTSGAFQRTNIGADHHSPNAFVTKLNAAGSALVYSTYLGGTGAGYSGEWVNGIALDASGNAYLTGQTSSIDFPIVSGGYQTEQPNEYGHNSAFVTKLNAKGSALIYSTYLGGSGNVGPGENGSSIAVNKSGEAYVTGYSYSPDFPVTPGAFQSTNNAYNANGSNAFVAELNAAGTDLVYSTYLGGSTRAAALEDSAYALALDASGNAHLAGVAASTDFPVTSGVYQAKSRAGSTFSNGFVSELNATGTKLVYSTYLGGSGQTGCGGDAAMALALDASGNSYVTGATCSSNFPVTSGAYQTSNKAYAAKSQTAFLAELNPAGSSLLYSTYLGGSGTTKNPLGDAGNALALSGSNVYLAGATESTNFPVTASAYQKSSKATAGDSEVFVAEFAFNAAVKTSTSLVTDGSPQKAGVKVTFTARVTDATGSAVSSGTVGFAIDGGAAVPVTLDDTGHATYSTATLKAGVHAVVASYAGDATHLASSGKLSQTIDGPVATLAVVSGSGQSSAYGTSYKAPLLVVAKDSAGDLLAGVTITYSGTGLKFASTTAATGSNGQASVVVEPVATGSLTASATAGGSTGPASFALTATKASIAVTANNISVAQGASIPALTYRISGLVNGDSSNQVSGKPAETTTAKKGSAAGSYPISVAAGSLAATNYSFKLVNGTVTITAATGK